jgi:hypothetical protein
MKGLLKGVMIVLLLCIFPKLANQHAAIKDFIQTGVFVIPNRNQPVFLPGLSLKTAGL